MFVPWTKKGLLAGKLRQAEERLANLTGFRIRYTEEGGTQLWRFFNTGLAAGLECGRAQCGTCEQDDENKINCFTRSTVYESVCLLCHPEGKVEKSGEMVQNGKGTYTGETSRSLFERVREHKEDADKMDKESHMVKHWFLEHPEEEDLPKFVFRMVGKYGDCLTRQVKEAVRIQNRPGTLNSKGEFGGGRIPRLVIEKSDYEERKARMDELKENEIIEKKWEDFVKGRKVKEQNKGKRKQTNHEEGPILKRRRKLDESIPEGWNPVKQLAIEFRGLPAIEFIPADVEKKKSADSGQVQHREAHENTKPLLMLEYIPCEGSTKQDQYQPTNHQNETWQQNCTKWSRQPTDDDKVRCSLPKKTRSVRGGKKGKGEVCMTVLDITEHMKKLAKNENLNCKGPPISFSPKRKQTFEKSDISSPSKRNKFQHKRQFWKSLEGAKDSKKTVPGFETTPALVRKSAIGSETILVIDICVD